MEFPSFLLPANGQVSPETLLRRRKMAEGMLTSGIDTSPIASPWQGASRLAQALVGGLSMHNADKAEQEGRKGFQDQMLAAMTGGTPNDSQIASMMGDPWAQPGQTAMLADMYKSAHTPAETKVLNEGDVWMDSSGNTIGKGNAKTFAPQQPSSDIQEYEFYAARAKAAGVKVLPPEEFWQLMKKSGASASMSGVTSL